MTHTKLLTQPFTRVSQGLVAKNNLLRGELTPYASP